MKRDKTCDEGPAAKRNFTRTMQALFKVPKSAVVETKHKPARKKRISPSGSAWKVR